MELGVFAKKRLRSFAVVFLLVIAIEADIFTTWYHGPNEDTIKTYVAREILGKTVKNEWRQWKQDGVFTESTVNNVKEVSFSPTAREPLAKILGYLNYFPLLEQKSVIYNIPVDGQTIKLKLIPDKTKGTFTANYLYTDASGQHETRLTNSKKIMQELHANTKEFPKLRQALRFAMPEILRKEIRKKGIFDREFRTATSGSTTPIPTADKDKAFRNALEAMFSTSVLRKSPETWIAKANSEVKAQSSNLRISMKNAIKREWRDWKSKGHFTEKTDQKTNIKKITFKTGLSISPIEIFHTLQYFRDLESGTVRYSIPIDGVPIEFEFTPKSSNPKDFTVKSVRKDSYGKDIKTDISDYSSLRKAIDKDVFSTDDRELGLAISDSFPKLFSLPEANNPKDVFKEQVKEETKRTKGSISPYVQEKVFRNTVDLLAASIVLKKPIPKIYWMNNVYERINSKVEIQDSKVRNKATAVAAKKSWETMTNKYTQTNTNPKEITFKTDAGLTVKDIFDHLRHFTAFETQPVIYKFPIDGQDVKLKLAPDGKGGFTAEYLYEDAAGQTQVTDLTDTEVVVHDLMGTTQGQKLLSNTLESTVPELFKQKLADTGKFDAKLTQAISKTLTKPNIQNDLKEKALRQTLEAMASMSLMGNDAKTWVDRMDSDMERKRVEVEDSLNKKIIEEGKVELKHELALSLTEGTNEIKAKWKQLKDLGYIETDEDSATGLVSEIKINNDIPYNLKDTFRLLQRFHDVYPNQGQNRAAVTIPIGGEDRKFELSIGTQGKNQLLIESRDRDWPGSTRKTGKTVNELITTSYKEMLDKGLRTFDSRTLAGTMLEAIHSRLNAQPDFSKELEIKGGLNPQQKTKDMIRGTVEFLLTTMIAEASNPPSNVRDNFNENLVANIGRKRKHPSLNEMPHLDKLTDAQGRNVKEGRSPTADMVAIKLLEKIERTGRRFDRVFRDSADRYPFMKVDGGTAEGRKYLFAHGDDQIPSTVILEEAAGDHDGETIAKRARMSCTGSRKRRKRQACSLEEVNDHMIVDDKSIKVEDSKVELELVDRRDATNRKRLTIPITPEELATPQVIQQKIANSERAEGSSKYAKVNKGLAVHGLIFSAIGAIDYFQRGDNVHGGIAVSQSLHTLGGLTGFNEIASKAAKQVLRHAALKVARGLNMEKGLERFSLKVEKYMEKGVGKLMGDLPGVGLAFDIYFIEQDIEALSHLDLNNPEDVKMLPLRVVDLVLDVETTVLNLIGTFCPEAEVITEPLIIVLSIVRMAIDDFYVDIMEEMDKVNWNSPWAGFEFIGALFKGILEGAADFLSGGLRRQMENYSKQEKADKQLISSLKDATSYYKITGKKGEKTIDFTQGKLSSFGGFITFRMCDDGMAHLEIGDVTGHHETVTKTFKIDHDVKDIVLGIGESREFLYETKTAKLWAFIPIKHYKVIKNANLKSYSLFGTYYGNNKNNKFYAVQAQKKQKQKDHRQCDYGKLDIGFVTGRYHYNLYGRGGDDLFYLGPQMSKVTGGKGSDVYIVQSYGGNTIIDNFAEDNKRDMVIINVPYNDISCTKNGEDLDILYQNTHHIRITHWFVPGNTKYYRHISFKSKDGIIFLAKDIPNGAKCTPVAIAKGGDKPGERIDLSTAKFSEVKQVVGTDGEDRIYGNDLNNLLDGGKGTDYLEGGKSEDTYIIREKEGCDTINNYASDYKKTTDVVIFNVKYERIRLKISGMDLKLHDSTNPKSCVIIQNWLRGEEYRHMIFTSLDHLVFKVKQSNNQYTKFPMVLDYSSSTKGVKVSLKDGGLKDFIYSKGFEQVATVSDSKHSDIIIGNDQSNFLSCTGGNDQLFGGPGSDNYIVKRSCNLATIVNLDTNKKVDLLLLDYKFEELKLSKQSFNDLVINYNVNQPKVILQSWFILPDYRHLWVRTKDGVTLRINSDKLTLEPVEISKDPEECLCKGNTCQPQHIKYDLTNDPWKTVTRFQLKSTLCSYNIRGNDLNNYIDPGSGNGYTYQRLRGGNGADTYVLKHGYGEFNVINNIASDSKNDTLKLGLEVSDINFRFYRENDVILASKTRPKSLTVRIRHYFKGPEYQHLLVTTADEVTFQIQKEPPFMKVISVDMSQFESPQHPTLDETVLSSEAQSVKGTQNYPNTILGTSSTKEIEGGFKDDILTGGSGDNIIKGRQGDDKLFGMGGHDIIFGGDGDDFIKGGDGNDYIYGGNGKDTIDGGEGGDTICFKGDGFDKKGVYIDLSGGFGKDADAEGDKYTSIEHVYGTIHADTLIGSDSDNNLHGLNGDDVIIAKGGDDQLTGGNGADRYVLDEAYGIKTIDNYAKDKVKDTLSLAKTYSDDVCVFLVNDDLHFQVKPNSLTTLLYQKRTLSVVVLNWNKSYQYRHLNILFKDTFWPSRALGKVKQHIHQKKAIVEQTEKESSFALTSGVEGGLSWKPYQQLRLDEDTQFELLQYDLDNPQDTKQIDLTNDVIAQGTYTVPNFARNKHYIFALLMKYCSAIIAKSHSLTYLGEKRACSAINVPNSQIAYKTPGSYVHESQANLTCSQGYKFKMSDIELYIVTCIDGTWQPKLPECVAKANCAQLTKPANGKVRSQSTLEGAIVTYACDKGFQLAGSKQRRCGEDGKWAGEEPKCERINCFQLPKVKNGKLDECNGNSKIYGTMQSPKHGFCVKLTCDANFVEYWRMNKVERTFEKLLPGSSQSEWFCRGSRWKGVGKLACVPATRLTQKTSTWYADNGVLQEWDDANARWKNSLSRDTKEHQHACANAVGMENYAVKPRILSSNAQSLKIACPRIRFSEMITLYEGKLETLVQGKWQRTCMVGPDYRTRLRPVYQHMCTELGIAYNKPVVGAASNGPTTHLIRCLRESSDINACAVETYSIADCASVLQCKRRCNNDYSVANGQVKPCTGKFEGDTCQVVCTRGYRLIGPSKVYCTSGVWSDQRGNKAISRCER